MTDGAGQNSKYYYGCYVWDLPANNFYIWRSQSDPQQNGGQIHRSLF
jgi:hypothetical protein